MDGPELRRRLDQLKRPYTELAPLLGLSVDGLHHQMRGVRRVSRQTELLLEQLERDCIVAPPAKPRRTIKPAILLALALTAAALAHALIALPAAAQVGSAILPYPPPLSAGGAERWTGQRIGNTDYWRDEEGRTWTSQRLGSGQLWQHDPDGRSRLCTPVGKEMHCR